MQRGSSYKKTLNGDELRVTICLFSDRRSLVRFAVWIKSALNGNRSEDMCIRIVKKATPDYVSAANVQHVFSHMCIYGPHQPCFSGENKQCEFARVRTCCSKKTTQELFICRRVLSRTVLAT